MISEVALNTTFTNPFGNEEITNAYLFHSEDVFVTLTDIYDGRARYSSHMMADLANAMELLDKGLCIELSKMHPEDQTLMGLLSTRAFNMEHEFVDSCIKKINKILPISSSYGGYTKLLDNFRKIESAYTDGKYRGYYTKEDFDWAYRQLSTHRERMYKALEQELFKFRAKEAMQFEEPEEPEPCPF